ncbi:MULTISPECIES: hypothetical protein [unclassified Streptomyces]|uniref:hypothetical protein n=1 Tax=unclassified Streptomyces TaxID=2593676 RepID=UPI0038229070
MLGLAQLMVVLDTTIVYDEGGAENGTTRARGSRSAPTAPGSVTGSIATTALPFRALPQ